MKVEENRKITRSPICWLCKKEIFETQKSVILEYSPYTPVVAHEDCVNDKFLYYLEHGSDEQVEFWDSFLHKDSKKLIDEDRTINICPYCEESVSAKQDYGRVWFRKRKLAVHKSCLTDDGLLKWTT